MAKRTPEERLFSGVYPTGFYYADRSREKFGDYARCGMLFFSNLELKIEDDCPAELRTLIEDDARKYQLMAGQKFTISSSVQFITLGFDLPEVKMAAAREAKAHHDRQQAAIDQVRANGYKFTTLENWANELQTGRPAALGDVGGTVMYDPSGVKPSYRRVAAEECIEAAIADGFFSSHPEGRSHTRPDHSEDAAPEAETAEPDPEDDAFPSP